jgi:transposase
MHVSDGAVRTSGKRRYRSAEEKRLIVEETLAANESVATIARRHGVNANQLFAWRKLHQRGLLEPSGRPNETRLLPVTVVEEAEAEAEREVPAVAASAGMIHIEFPGRALVSVEGCADPALVRAVLESLKR